MHSLLKIKSSQKLLKMIYYISLHYNNHDDVYPILNDPISNKNFTFKLLKQKSLHDTKTQTLI